MPFDNSFGKILLLQERSSLVQWPICLQAKDTSKLGAEGRYDLKNVAAIYINEAKLQKSRRVESLERVESPPPQVYACGFLV